MSLIQQNIAICVYWPSAMRVLFIACIVARTTSSDGSQLLVCLRGEFQNRSASLSNGVGGCSIKDVIVILLCWSNKITGRRQSKLH